MYAESERTESSVGVLHGTSFRSACMGSLQLEKTSYVNLDIQVQDCTPDRTESK